MSINKYSRAEITTLLLVAGVVLLGIFSVVSSLFVRNTANSLSYKSQAMVINEGDSNPVVTPVITQSTDNNSPTQSSTQPLDTPVPALSLSPTPALACGGHGEGSTWCDQSRKLTCINNQMNFLPDLDYTCSCGNLYLGEGICVSSRRYTSCTESGKKTINCLPDEICDNNLGCVPNDIVPSKKMQETISQSPAKPQLPTPIVSPGGGSGGGGIGLTPPPIITPPGDRIFMCVEKKSIKILDENGLWVDACQCTSKQSVSVVTKGACY